MASTGPAAAKRLREFYEKKEQKIEEHSLKKENKGPKKASLLQATPGFKTSFKYKDPPKFSQSQVNSFKKKVGFFR